MFPVMQQFRQGRHIIRTCPKMAIGWWLLLASGAGQTVQAALWTGWAVVLCSQYAAQILLASRANAGCLRVFVA
ncbi:hypothetical protein ACNR0F_09930 [Kingella kingae]|uniref:hypothetical protein n=1 Tax=Kingella kingae TaxID=504 RepID=UPI003AB5DA51